MGLFGPSAEIHTLRETMPRALDSTQLGEAIQNIVQEQGSAAFTSAQCRVDTSSQHLPAMEISTASGEVIRGKKEEQAAIIAAKAAQPQHNLEGGLRGLIDRTDSDNDNKLTRDEIQTRLRSGNLPQGDAAALKTLLRDYDEIDGNNNDRINHHEIMQRERTARDNQLNLDRLTQLQKLLAERRKDIDRNGDGRSTRAELATAADSESLFNRQERDLLDWAEDNWS